MQELPPIVAKAVLEFAKDAKLLEQMAGVYPGDITGDISRDSFLLQTMADILADYDWSEITEDYESNRPKIVVFYCDAMGNPIEAQTNE